MAEIERIVGKFPVQFIADAGYKSSHNDGILEGLAIRNGILPGEKAESSATPNEKRYYKRVKSSRTHSECKFGLWESSFIFERPKVRGLERVLIEMMLTGIADLFIGIAAIRLGIENKTDSPTAFFG